MTAPGPGSPVVANPLQWQLEPAVAPNGLKIVRATFNQGNLAAQLILGADDADELAKQLSQMARQSRTGIILPSNGTHIPPQGLS